VYVILVYDVGVERLEMILKLCRRYLNWVQNSVFEGEISEANLMRLKKSLQGIIDEDNDSIIIYILRDGKYIRKETIGVAKGATETLI